MSQSKSLLDNEKVATHALVLGDSKRATDAAALLTDSSLIWEQREFKAYTGTRDGKKITICSHGVGASCAAIIFEKLFHAGVRTVIRAGTCGAMVAGVPDGALIIGTGAIRSDGLTQAMVPMEYPAIADRRVVKALEDSAAELGFKDIPVGVILTDGIYYPYPYIESRLDMWPKLGAVAIEMEFATLLIQAAIHGAKAGGIFTSDGNVIEEPDPWAVDADREVVRNGISNMLQVAISALVNLD